MKKSPDLTFENYDFSGEFFSKETNSPFAIKNSEIKNLDSKRKLGISGHLRAKNEVFSLEYAIDSSIPALDELIITIQPYINESGKDETYEIAKRAKEKYKDKIKLFYYTPKTSTFNGSHITNENICDNRSVHSFSHYTNFGLKEISYKYYMKIDADQIYFTQKLLELREAILSSDIYTKDKRSFFDKALGKLCNPFYNVLVRILPLKTYIKLITLINKRVSFGLSGIQFTLDKNLAFNQIRGGQQGIESNINTLLNSPLKKSLLKKMFIPLKIHYDRFYCLNGGMDHYIFAPNSKNIYFYFEDHGVETQNGIGHKGVRNLGCFWVHLGMIKRYFLVEGKENEDYISVENFLHTKINNLKNKMQIKAHYKPDYQGSLDNINIHLENDKKYLKEILKNDEIKE